MPTQELLGEGLRAFEPCGGASRAEAAQARLGERIDDARHQRRLGTDDGEMHALGTCQLDERADIVRGDADVAHPGLSGGAGITRRHQHLGNARRRSAFPGECVLAPAAADDQHLHKGTPRS